MGDTKEVVMFESEDAAQLKTVTGWVSRDGRFYGDDERIARYAGCTHRKCGSCESTVEKYRIYCDACTSKRTIEKYLTLESKPWDGETPLCTYDDDRYFFDWESVEEYCEDNEIKLEDLMLVICDPVKPSLLDANEMFCDELAEDGECPEEVANAIEAVNEAIRKASPFSWYPGKFRAIFASGAASR